MAYSTLEDMAGRVTMARIIQLVDDERLSPEEIDPDNPDHAPMAERVRQVIDYADSVIDAHIAARYKLPLARTPELLRTMSTELGFYKLLARVNPEIEKAWQMIHDDHLAMLRRISDGKAVLDGLTPSEMEKQESSGEFVSGNVRLFSRDSLKGF